MNVRLLNDPDELLANCVTAIRTCWDSFDRQDSWWDANGFNLGPNDKALVQTIINNGHTSTLEHLIFTFEIRWLSRAALQEIVRHRHGSFSVQSTRYTLKRFMKAGRKDLVVLTGDPDVDTIIQNTMSQISSLLAVRPDIHNDLIKYAIPEAYKTNLMWTINARSLRNFMGLRSSKRALQEMRELAKEVWGVLPEQMRFIFQDVYHIQVWE